MKDRSESVRTMKSRKLARFAWPAGVLTVLLGLMFFMTSPFSSKAEPQKAAASAGPPKGLPVEAAPVVMEPASRELTAVGTLQSNESVTVAAEIAGRVSDISFSEGEMAARGKVLLRLDPSVLAAERDRAKANLGLSEANYKRAELLLKDSAVSQRERDEAYSKWKLDEANLRLAEAQLAKATIRAPFEGVVGLRKVSPGSYLKPGDTIATLDDIDPIKVDFRVPEVYADQVKVGQPVKLTVDAVPGRAFEGKVYAIDPQVDTQGRSLLVRARVANADGPLRQGMFARIALELERRAEALTVPEEAIIGKGDQQLVFKVVDGKVEPAPVKLGIRSRGRVEIVEGLRAGETVITAGHMKVRPGMPVTVLPTAAQAAQTQKGS